MSEPRTGGRGGGCCLGGAAAPRSPGQRGEVPAGAWGVPGAVGSGEKPLEALQPQLLADRAVLL